MNLLSSNHFLTSENIFFILPGLSNREYHFAKFTKILENAILNVFGDELELTAFHQISGTFFFSKLGLLNVFSMRLEIQRVKIILNKNDL